MNKYMALPLIAVACCCSSLVACAFIYPVPKKEKGVYKEFEQVSKGRVPPDPNSDAFKCGIEQVCSENCEYDFTCKGFSVWKKKGDVFCLKSTTKPNPWFAIPEKIANKEESKIFVKR